jgi:hypothetical protein
MNRWIWMALFASLLASCGERVCSSGDRRSCVCPDGNQAIQACGDDGQYGLCGCPGVDVGGADLAGAPADSGGQSVDLAGGDLTSSAAPDLLSTGTKQFGDMCSAAGSTDCAPGLICDRFAMGTVFRCTRMCPGGCDAVCCPAPSAGSCNAKGECKFLN